MSLRLSGASGGCAIKQTVLQPTRARLPATSLRGVEEASVVGSVIVPEYRGPNGFRWIIPNRLAGCPEPGVSAPIDYDLELLRGVGVTHLLTLTEEDLDQGILERNGLKNLHISIIDREAPSIRQAYMVVYRMQEILNQGGVLAVHCRAGTLCHTCPHSVEFPICFSAPTNVTNPQSNE